MGVRGILVRKARLIRWYWWITGIVAALNGWLIVIHRISPVAAAFDLMGGFAGGGLLALLASLFPRLVHAARGLWRHTADTVWASDLTESVLGVAGWLVPPADRALLLAYNKELVATSVESGCCSSRWSVLRLGCRLAITMVVVAQRDRLKFKLSTQPLQDTLKKAGIGACLGVLFMLDFISNVVQIMAAQLSSSAGRNVVIIIMVAACVGAWHHLHSGRS